MNRSIFFRIVMALVLIGVMFALGVFVYNAGMMQGLAQSTQAQGGAPAAAPYPMYVMPYWPFWYGGFGFFFVPIIGLFIFFGIMRAIFWHGRPGWRHMNGPDDTGNGVPPRFEEWHRRMHEGQSTPPAEK
jgi:hypothetical protein